MLFPHLGHNMRINTNNICHTLHYLDHVYNKAVSSKNKKGPLHAVLYSKLAILELSGWIEETIDNILLEYVDKKISDIALQEIIKTEIIGKVYGFKYHSDYKPLMIKVLGPQKYHKVYLALVKNHQHDIFCSQLNELTKQRDVAAHTSSKEGVTPHFYAPSSTYVRFKTIYQILKIINRTVGYL